ncbi:MAG: T9SS type A sorting domain-containing protein [Bacteroidales bacterium]
MAVSYDPLGAPGTWKKYYSGEFNEEGLGGKSSPVSNLSNVGGANPSVHWNTYFEKWVMTYHGWDGGIYVTLSSDGIQWEYPKKIISKEGHNRWYPTIIGETDTKAGKLARIYYAEFNASGRQMAARDILFDTIDYNIDYGAMIDPWEAQNVGSFSFPGKAGIRNGMITITGTTNILFGEYDAFYYMYQKVTGNGEISAKLTSQTGVNNMAYSGIMLRSSSASASDFISISRKSLTDTLIISYRDANTQLSKTKTISGNFNWLKIKKEGSAMELLFSEDGISWNPAFSVLMELSTDFIAGLFTTSHNESNFCTATFENTLVNFRLVNVDKVKSEAIRIHPNPAIDKIYITIQNEIDMYSYTLMDIFGKIYKKGQLKGKYSELDILDLSSSQLYILQIFDGNKDVHGAKIFKR